MEDEILAHAPMLGRRQFSEAIMSGAGASNSQAESEGEPDKGMVLGLEKE